MKPNAMFSFIRDGFHTRERWIHYLAIKFRKSMQMVQKITYFLMTERKHDFPSDNQESTDYF